MESYVHSAYLQQIDYGRIEAHCLLFTPTTLIRRCELISIAARPSLPFSASGAYSWDGLACQTSLVSFPDPLPAANKMAAGSGSGNATRVGYARPWMYDVIGLPRLRGVTCILTADPTARPINSFPLKSMARL